ncbi:hypothetical protein MUK42_36548 [Musa troglodytarum]|uniref:Uncharacterized protein n=1 Tax=Musa troglodytarum TaxID=320322 RepID=A0A9E7I4I1_9LILI|nr:hypothetical protein MUK42_36548 [Musa troglodytarum]URE41323.1 hypothetical protein MUK42_36548 [Musa troglodytarum]URE41324.1 hypothetical protein MUK42_36548 [Musa troglodytarum]
MTAVADDDDLVDPIFSGAGHAENTGGRPSTFDHDRIESDLVCSFQRGSDSSQLDVEAEGVSSCSYSERYAAASHQMVLLLSTLWRKKAGRLPEETVTW